MADLLESSTPPLVRRSSRGRQPPSRYSPTSGGEDVSRPRSLSPIRPVLTDQAELLHHVEVLSRRLVENAERHAAERLQAQQQFLDQMQLMRREFLQHVRQAEAAHGPPATVDTHGPPATAREAASLTASNMVAPDLPPSVPALAVASAALVHAPLGQAIAADALVAPLAIPGPATAAPVAPMAAPRLLPVSGSLKPFSGTPVRYSFEVGDANSPSLVEFVSAFETLHRLSAYPEAMWPQAVIPFCTGVAAQVVRSALQAEPAIAWPALVQQLRARFLLPDEQNHLRQRLQSLTQCGAVTAYIDEFRRLSFFLTPGSLPAHILTDYFVNGLQDDERKLVHLHKIALRGGPLVLQGLFDVLLQQAQYTVRGC